MTPDERSAGALMTAPAGQALLALVAGLDLSAGDLAEPLTAFRIATQAMDMINPWDPTTPARRERLASDTPARRPLAEQIMAAPDLAWWWAPLDRDHQLWSSDAGNDQPASGFDRATSGPMTGWEQYAHKPHPTILTSTATAGGISSLVIGTALGHNDLRKPGQDTIQRRRVRIRSTARVYEVTGPSSWATLARRYPSLSAAGRPHLFTPAEVVPDWPAVAHDWDGVHVPLGSLILANDVWVTDDAGASRLWGWDNEGTYWLRDAFDASEPMPDIAFDDVPDAFSHGDILGNPALKPLLWLPDLMAGNGPEAIALRSSRAVSTIFHRHGDRSRRRGQDTY